MEYYEVDPRLLRLPPSRVIGADPIKLRKQIAQFGNSTTEMPNLVVYRLANGEFVIYDGVTRATRVAKLLPGETVKIEVIGELPNPRIPLPTVGDRLP